MYPLQNLILEVNFLIKPGAANVTETRFALGVISVRLTMLE